jgi:hypothetical protein
MSETFFTKFFIIGGDGRLLVTSGALGRLLGIRCILSAGGHLLVLGSRILAVNDSYFDGLISTISGVRCRENTD